MDDEFGSEADSSAALQGLDEALERLHNDSSRHRNHSSLYGGGNGDGGDDDGDNVTTDTHHSIQQDSSMTLSEAHSHDDHSEHDLIHAKSHNQTPVKNKTSRHQRRSALETQTSLSWNQSDDDHSEDHLFASSSSGADAAMHRDYRDGISHVINRSTAAASFGIARSPTDDLTRLSRVWLGQHQHSATSVSADEQTSSPPNKSPTHDSLSLLDDHSRSHNRDRNRDRTLDSSDNESADDSDSDNASHATTVAPSQSDGQQKKNMNNTYKNKNKNKNKNIEYQTNSDHTSSTAMTSIADLSSPASPSNSIATSHLEQSQATLARISESFDRLTNTGAARFSSGTTKNAKNVSISSPNRRDDSDVKHNKQRPTPVDQSDTSDGSLAGSSKVVSGYLRDKQKWQDELSRIEQRLQSITGGSSATESKTAALNRTQPPISTTVADQSNFLSQSVHMPSQQHSDIYNASFSASGPARLRSNPASSFSTNTSKKLSDQAVLVGQLEKELNRTVDDFVKQKLQHQSQASQMQTDMQRLETRLQQEQKRRESEQRAWNNEKETLRRDMMHLQTQLRQAQGFATEQADTSNSVLEARYESEKATLVRRIRELELDRARTVSNSAQSLSLQKLVAENDRLRMELEQLRQNFRVLQRRDRERDSQTTADVKLLRQELDRKQELVDSVMSSQSATLSELDSLKQFNTELQQQNASMSQRLRELESKWSTLSFEHNSLVHGIARMPSRNVDMVLDSDSTSELTVPPTPKSGTANEKIRDQVVAQQSELQARKSEIDHLRRKYDEMQRKFEAAFATPATTTLKSTHNDTDASMSNSNAAAGTSNNNDNSANGVSFASEAKAYKYPAAPQVSAEHSAPVGPLSRSATQQSIIEPSASVANFSHYAVDNSHRSLSPIPSDYSQPSHFSDARSAIQDVESDARSERYQQQQQQQQQLEREREREHQREPDPERNRERGHKVQQDHPREYELESNSYSEKRDTFDRNDREHDYEDEYSTRHPRQYSGDEFNDVNEEDSVSDRRRDSHWSDRPAPTHQYDFARMTLPQVTDLGRRVRIEHLVC
jgi:hypothetical protein